MKHIDVMIVDDDKLAIDYLQSLFDWEKHGFNIVATALNGNQGYKQYLKYVPQLVITDLRMPHVDGIDLIKNIRKHSKETKILLLTAYCDFDVAKSAIELGITEYIIKDEINETSIQEKLLKIKESINKDRNIANVLSAKALSDIFSSKNSNVNEYIADIGTLVETCNYAIFIERDKPFLIASEAYESSDFNDSLLNEMLNHLDLGVDIRAVNINRDRMVLLVKGELGASQYRIKSQLIQMSRTVKNELAEKTRNEFSFFIVPELKNILELKELYQIKKSVTSEKYFLGCGEIYDIFEIRAGSRVDNFAFDSSFAERSLTDGSCAELGEYLEKSYQTIAGHEDLESLVSFTNAYMDTLARLIKPMPDVTEHSDLSALLIEGRQCLDIKQAKRWIFSTIQRFCLAINRHYSTKYSYPVKKSIEYINKNYRIKTLSITQIAESAGLSASRLSVLFKGETNQTINNYITFIRIEKAKTLLMQGELRINQVAEEIGYGSSQYFSQVFYEITGLSPREFRRNSGAE